MGGMRTVKLGDRLEMPMVGFGTWQIKGRKAYDAVHYALEVGYRHIDTATMYGNEEEVGRALRDSGVPRPGGPLPANDQEDREGEEQLEHRAR